MRLLLDEMYPPVAAEQLRSRGIDAVAVKESPALMGLEDDVLRQRPDWTDQSLSPRTSQTSPYSAGPPNTSALSFATRSVSRGARTTSNALSTP